jgi:hypothetical protein
MRELTAGERLALHELLASYGDTIDVRAWHRLGELFSENAVFDVSDINRGEHHGLAAIEDFLRRAPHPLAHHITNIYVTQRDDGTVEGSSRLLAVLADGSTRSGSYADIIAQSPAGWRIVRRRFELRRAPRG